MGLNSYLDNHSIIRYLFRKDIKEKKSPSPGFKPGPPGSPEVQRLRPSDALTLDQLGFVIEEFPGLDEHADINVYELERQKIPGYQWTITTPLSNEKCSLPHDYLGY